jgi:hypothetical protein
VISTNFAPLIWCRLVSSPNASPTLTMRPALAFPSRRYRVVSRVRTNVANGSKPLFPSGRGPPLSGRRVRLLVRTRRSTCDRCSAVWLATGHTDMRKGFPGPSLMVQETLKRDPHSGHLFRRSPGRQHPSMWRRTALQDQTCSP